MTVNLLHTYKVLIRISAHTMILARPGHHYHLRLLFANGKHDLTCTLVSADSKPMHI